MTTTYTDAHERLQEIAYRDEAKSVTVRADDLRELLAERKAAIQPQGYLISVPRALVERWARVDAWNAPKGAAMELKVTAEQMLLHSKEAVLRTQGGEDRVFIEEIGTNGKPTGYITEMYGELERSLRNRQEYDGPHGVYPDKLCIKAADAISSLRVALASQIDITNTERGYAENAAKLLAVQPPQNVHGDGDEQERQA